MTWLNDNWEHVLAVVGGLYAVARTVVYLTPTPKDDELLAKFATLFGLDSKQGVQGDS